jgi:hypothetical protein
MTEQPPRVWSSSGNLIVAHRYGGCYDVVQIGDTGCDVVEEISTLPEDAVEYGPVSPVDAETVTVRVEPLRELVRHLEHDALLVDEESSFDCGIRCGMQRAASQLSDALDVLPPTARSPATSVDAETVERCARASCSPVAEASGVPWEQLPDSFREMQRQEVRAVLAELGVRVEARHREAGAATHQTRRRLEPPCMSCGRDRREVAPDECKDKRSHRRESGSGNTTEGGAAARPS